MSALYIALIALVAVVLILVLVGILFDAAYKKDASKADVPTKWNDRCRNWLGLPWSFTKYSLSDDRLFIQQGCLKTRYDEVRLYRILDLEMSQSLWQKITKSGTIKLHTSDKTLKDFELINIKDPRHVKELISSNVEIQRDKHRVYSRETMDDHDIHDSDFEFDDNI